MLIEGFLPLAEVSLRTGFTREQLIRRIQNRKVRGDLIAGRWHVVAADIGRLEQERSDASDFSPAA